MFLEFSKYYYIKRTLKKLPQAIRDRLSFDDATILNLASFNTLPNYFRILNPFIKDRYNLANKLNELDGFNKFILECLYIVKREDKLDKLLLLYTIVLNHTFTLHIDRYLNAIKDPKLSIDEAHNMLDFYLASKNDEIDLSKTNVYKKYPNAFKVEKYMIEVVREPLIKLFSQFSIETMLIKCQKRRKFIYNYICKPNWFNKAILKSYDFIFRLKDKYHLVDLPYYGKIDTRILNLNNSEYEIDGIKYNKSFDDVLKEAKIDGLNKLNAINDYLFNKHDKALRKEFNIADSIILDE